MGAYAIVVVPGFCALALLGSLGHYSPRLLGFWGYPSGTIGDALVVPALIAGLVGLSHALKPWSDPHELRWQLLGGVIGGVGGGIVPLSWYLDPSTKHIWMLPYAHHYVLAGWWHLVYLTAATAALGYLTATILYRRRNAATVATTPQRAAFFTTAVTIVVGAGLGMLVLIGRDAINGGRTAATITTVVALGLAAIAFLAGLAWANRGIPWRAAVVPTAIIAAFLAGLVGLIVGWRPPDPAIVGVAAISALLACLAATSQLSEDPQLSPYRWPTALAMTTTSVAGFVRSIDALLQREPRPLLWLVGGVALAFLLLTAVGREKLEYRRLMRHMLFSAYCLFLYYLASRIRAPLGSHSAAASVAVADTAFDVMVFALIQARFSDLGEADKLRVESEFISSPAQIPVLSASPASSAPSSVVYDMLQLVQRPISLLY